jgi:hypothetical protein
LVCCPIVGETFRLSTDPQFVAANRARQALKMAAMSLSRSDSALGAFYWCLSQQHRN